MAAEEIMYLNSYLKNGRIITGNFPITVNGYINCADNPGLSYEEKERVLGERPDPDYFLQKQYLIGFDHNYYYQTSDLSGDNLLFF